MKSIYIAFLMILFSISNLSAQEVYKDKVSLRDGSVIYGHLLNYNTGGSVIIKIVNGSTLTLPDSLVQKVETNALSSKGEKKYSFRSKGYFSMVGFKIIPGTGELLDISRNGLGIDYSFGYRENELFSIGAGIGVHTYNYGFGEFFFPVYLDMMSFFKKSIVSPFLKVQMGYSFVSATAENVIDSNGGLILNPAFGMRLTGNKNVNYSFDLNYLYQKANFAFKKNTWNNAVSYRDIAFRRFSLRFGILF